MSLDAKPARSSRGPNPRGESRETAAADRIVARTEARPRLAVILGSGFRAFEKRLEVETAMDYGDIPGLGDPSVPGHAGRLLVGRVAHEPVLVFSGRLHYYEGHSLWEATLPIRIAAVLGIKQILLTNAAGGINHGYRRGDFMVLEDHLNFMGANPLRGVGDVDGRFVDLSRVYDPALGQLLLDAARGAEARCHSGVYLAVSGPSYETPAEIRAFERMGADAVGMSTAPEAIVARYRGMRVAGLSMITNPAAGRSEEPITHQEVLEVGRRSGEQAARIIEAFCGLVARDDC